MPEECVKNENFTDTRPPPTGTPSNLEGEFWLLLNLIDLRVEKELKTGYIKLDTLPTGYKTET